MTTTIKELTDQAQQLFQKIGRIDRRGITIDGMKKLLHAQNRAFDRYQRRLHKLLSANGLLRR
jgi:hypothetical protein